jgi:hypothetical protein
LTACALSSKANQFPADHRSTLVVANDVMTMRLDSRNGQSNPLAILDEMLSGVWTTENIEVVRRVIVSVIGATILLIGVALLILPGPAFIVIPVGLAILASEYAWARRWLRKVRRMASAVASRRERATSQDTNP